MLVLTAVALFSAASVPGSQAQVVTHIYELDGSYSDSLGGPALSPLGGTLNPTNYSFAANQGLTLSNGLVDPANYSIETIFNFTTLSGFRKIVDFKNRTSDNGLYDLNTALNFFPVTTGPAGAFSAGVNAHLVLTRDGVTKLVTGYVNGVSQSSFSFTDSSDFAVFTGPSNIAQFFIDDPGTGGEASAGVVDRIRIYDGVLSGAQVTALFNGGPPPGLPINGVPEPSAMVMLMGAGAAGLALLPRRKR